MRRAEPGALPPRGGPVGSTVEQPDPAIRSKFFIVEENQRGNAGQLELLGLFTGRLVDVYDAEVDPLTQEIQDTSLQQTDFVIGLDISNDSTYALETNPVTQKTRVIIKEPADSPAYIEALKRLGLNLTPISDKSLNPSELPPFSPAPRNSALPET